VILPALRGCGDLAMAQAHADLQRHMVATLGDEAMRAGDNLTAAQHDEMRARILRHARRAEDWEAAIFEYATGRT
jgi:hypothetical protein